jgi:hypothetical protein
LQILADEGCAVVVRDVGPPEMGAAESLEALQSGQAIRRAIVVTECGQDGLDAARARQFKSSLIVRSQVEIEADAFLCKLAKLSTISPQLNFSGAMFRLEGVEVYVKRHVPNLDL